MNVFFPLKNVERNIDKCFKCCYQKDSLVLSCMHGSHNLEITCLTHMHRKKVQPLLYQ